MTEPLESVDPAQSSQFVSPWPVSERVRRALWEFCWFIFCGWTPKPANPWRLFWLGVFDAKIQGTPFVHQRARIAVPWNLTLHDRRCLGDRTNVYSLGEIEIGARAVVAQEAYLNTGSHDFRSPPCRWWLRKSRSAKTPLSARGRLSCPGSKSGRARSSVRVRS